MIRYLLWSCTSELGLNHSHLLMSRTRFIPPREGPSVFFSFTGTRIKWFGTTGVRHGTANVYVDGAFVRTVDTWNGVSRRHEV